MKKKYLFLNLVFALVIFICSSSKAQMVLISKMALTGVNSSMGSTSSSSTNSYFSTNSSAYSTYVNTSSYTQALTLDYQIPGEILVDLLYLNGILLGRRNDESTPQTEVDAINNYLSQCSWQNVYNNTKVKVQFRFNDPNAVYPEDSYTTYPDNTTPVIKAVTFTIHN